jgi:hypothetical protein
MERYTPRAPRSPLIADVQILDLQSSKPMSAKTSDLSIGGCFLPMEKPLAVGTPVRLEVTHNGTTLTVFGDVVRSETGKGMAVRFRAIEPAQADILKRWFFALDRFDE